MQSHNLYVYASLRGATMEQVGSLTEERYQQLQKQVRMDWRLYLRGAISTVSGIPLKNGGKEYVVKTTCQTY